MINVMTTFWRFLNEHIIEIPIIQRDYAQGRLGKEELRKTFLKDLKQALDSCKPLKLDFVYGAVESGKLNPLDGQQRLTTLWLLHWYLAYMAGAMNKDVKRVLAKFTYETRISSREFCRCLADFDKLPPPGTDVVGHIQNQTWFRSAWNDDPTIQSMLRMLGGTAHNDNDGIEGVFHSCYDGECIECRLDQCPYSNAITYGEYWKRLIGTDCPIIFYSLDIHGINQTDDLYIKMNARGKPLTSFENFKADLVGYISRQAAVTSNAGNSCDKLNDPETGLAIKMDTNWMDIFWRNRSSDNAVDDIYFAFLNRYFFNAYVLQFEKTGDLQKAEDPIFDFLYGRKDGENEKIAYLGFDEIFRKVLNKDNTLLERLYNTLDNFSKFYTTQDKGVFSLFDAPWNCEKEVVEKFRFIPHYIGKESIIDFAGNRIRKIARITQPQRVVFHAICKFFEQGWNVEDAKKELLALKDWMRVVWNIVENANVETIPVMVGCLKLLNELGAHSHNILEWLGSGGKIESKVAKDQVAEEIEKAKKIIDDRNMWEQLIRKAEGCNVFRGAIRCLYTGAGKDKIDWGSFSVKWENAESYFTSEASRKYHCLRWLIMNCTKSTELNGIVYDICTDTWKKNLLNEDLCIAVDKFLKNPGPKVFGLGDNDFDTNEAPYKTAQEDLCSFGFLEGLSYNGSHVNGCMLRASYGQLALFPSNAKSEQKKYVIANKRNALLAALGDDIRTSQKLSNCNFYWGWDVYFEYNDHKFQWCRDNKVYLLDGKNQYIAKESQGASTADKYICFNTNELTCSKCLKEKLENLLRNT